MRAIATAGGFEDALPHWFKAERAVWFLRGMGGQTEECPACRGSGVADRGTLEPCRVCCFGWLPLGLATCVRIAMARGKFPPRDWRGRGWRMDRTVPDEDRGPGRISGTSYHVDI